jgi:hypothetical protein
LKASSLAPAFLAALIAFGCASSAWEKTVSVPGGKLYVPKVYAQLLPGSIYPNRRVPIKAAGLPAMVLVCPEKGDCRKDVILDRAAQRGLVVLAGREPKVDLLRTRGEANPERIGWLLVNPSGDSLRRWTNAGAPGEATAVIGPPQQVGSHDPLPSSPSKQKFLLAASLSGEPLEARDGTVLKLYSPNEKGLLPDEAYRDAVEWLAGALESH